MATERMTRVDQDTQQTIRMNEGQTGMSKAEAAKVLKSLGYSESMVEDLVIVRASEDCELKAHKNYQSRNLEQIENLLKKTAIDEDTLGAANLRLQMGIALEGYALSIAAKQLGGVINDTQLPVCWYYPDWHVMLSGHIDGVVYYDKGEQANLVECKTTSEANFYEVLNAIDSFDVESEMLEKYRKQMRRYSAMLFKTREPFQYGNIHGFSPMFGYLILVNRNTCEVATRQIALFDETEDPDEEYLNNEIKSILGHQHPLRNRQVARPSRLYQNHPLCQTCIYHRECYPYNTIGESLGDGETRDITRDYIDADRYIKTGEALKRRVRAKVVERMDAISTDKIDLGENGSITRSHHLGKTTLDTKKMKEDKIYDNYTKEGKPYDVIRFNVKR